MIPGWKRLDTASGILGLMFEAQGEFVFRKGSEVAGHTSVMNYPAFQSLQS